MKVLVYVEQRNGKLKNNAFEVMTLGRQLAGTSLDVIAVVIGKNIASLQPQLKGYGVDRVIMADHDDLANYNTLNYCAVMQKAIQECQPQVVLAPASPMGKDILPRLAARFDCGIITDAVAVHKDGNTIKALKPMYAGKCLAEVTITGGPIQFISIRPNTVKPLQSGEGSATLEQLSASLPDTANFKTKEIRKGENEKPDLTEASVIVSGGRAMGSAANFKIIEDCADVLGATVGASRAAVDAGYRSHTAQVGQTGKTVTPNLYIACGISGAIQHLAGMRTSKVIVAVNNDPEAPIFSICDYGIVGDIFEVVPLLTEKFKSVL